MLALMRVQPPVILIAIVRRACGSSQNRIRRSGIGYMLARLNAAAVFTLAIGALSVASAIFLILELDAPYSGMLRLPPAPILQAIDALGK